MIINFRIENFLSFRDEVEFTALATLERQHRKRIFQSKSPDLNLLPAAAFFGGNGAGKSNLYHALKYARSLVLKAGVQPESSTGREAFRLDPSCREAPSRFGFDLLIGKLCLRYEFAVTTNVVVAESLGFLKSDSVKMIFRRERKNDEDTWSSDSFHVLQLSKEDEEFIRFKRRDTLENQLFLSAVRGRKLPVLEELGNWFKRQLVLLNPHSDFRSVESGLMHLEDFRTYCLESLDKAGTGINDIQNDPFPVDSLPISERIRDEIIKKLQSEKGAMAMMFKGPDRTRFMLRKNNGSVEAFKLATYHQAADGERVSFELSDESEGTERMIDLLPAFFELTNPTTDKVFFIDELDRSLHTHLTRRLIESFLESREPTSRAQLFFTTHDPLLLDQELFRRDEIWFIDKLEDGHSKLTALSDFKGIRYDNDIRKNYLLGRFAGLPSIHSLPRRHTEIQPVK